MHPARSATGGGAAGAEALDRPAGGACVIDFDGQVRPGRGRPDRLPERPPIHRRQAVVRAEVDGRPRGVVWRGGGQVGDGHTVLVALGPGTAATAIGVHEPWAEGRDDGDAAPRWPVGRYENRSPDQDRFKVRSNAAMWKPASVTAAEVSVKRFPRRMFRTKSRTAAGCASRLASRSADSSMVPSNCLV